MSSGSYGKTIKELESMITYPPRRKQQPYCEPIKSSESKRLLEQYQASVAADAQERHRLRMANASAAAAQKQTHSGGSGLLEEADKAELAGKTEEALSCLLEAVRVGEESSEVFSRIGTHFMFKDDHNDAVEYFTKAILLDPLESSNYLKRAECHMALDDPANAFTEFEKFFKLETVGKAMLVRAGKCALDADQLEKAEYYLKKALAIEDEVDAINDAYAWYNLGELSEKRHDEANAAEYYGRVCSADPTFPAPYLEQAEDEYAAGNSAMALHLFEAVAKMTPTDPKVYIRLADVYTALGEEFSSSILTCLSKAVEFSTDREEYEKTIVRRGVLLFTSFGDVDQAIADFTMCLEGNPYYPDALLNRALALRARDGEGDQQSAVMDYTVLVGIPTVPWAVKAEPYRFLACSTFDDGDFITAAKLFSFASANGATNHDDEQKMYLAMAHQCVAQGIPTDEQYEPRGYTAPKENEKGKKVHENPFKGYPVLPVSYQVIDAYYLALRSREPTVHSANEYSFIAKWKPYRDEVERLREEAETLRLGKKGKKK